MPASPLARNAAFRVYRAVSNGLAPAIRRAYEHKHAQQWAALQSHQQPQLQPQPPQLPRPHKPAARWGWLRGWLSGAPVPSGAGDPHIGERWGKGVRARVGGGSGGGGGGGGAQATGVVEHGRAGEGEEEAKEEEDDDDDDDDDDGGDDDDDDDGGREEGACVWFHAASIGEGLSVLPLVQALLGGQQQQQQGGAPGGVARAVLTVGTVGGRRALQRAVAEAAAQQHPQQQHPQQQQQQQQGRLTIAYAPLDLDEDVCRFLARWRPSAAVWVESELWPNTLALLGARGVPLALVNARLSRCSARRWARWAPGLGAALARSFSRVLCRSRADAARWAQLRGLGERLPLSPPPPPPRGATHHGPPQGGAALLCLGDLKAGSPPLPPPCPGSLAPLAEAATGRAVWAVLSAHEDDERAALRAHLELRRRLPRLLTVLQPRQPERGAEVAAAAAAELFAAAAAADTAGGGGARRYPAAVVRRSLQGQGQGAGDGGGGGGGLASGCGVYVMDTLGESALAHALASVVLVGGTMGAVRVGGGGGGIGGHNVLEPMRAGSGAGGSSAQAAGGGSGGSCGSGGSGGSGGCAVLHGPDVSGNAEILAEVARVDAAAREAGVVGAAGRATWAVRADSSEEGGGGGADGGGGAAGEPSALPKLSDALALLLLDAEAQSASAAAAQRAAAVVGEGVIDRNATALRSWLTEHAMGGC